MFKRKTVLAQVLDEEKAFCEALNKLAASRSRASLHQLRWSKAEENGNFFCLFGKLAELYWIWTEVLRQMADKQKVFSKVFVDVYQEEKIVEEAKKALQACATRVSKLQKQLESARKKNDSVKVSSLEVELTTQSALHDHLSSSVEGQVQKLELYKLDTMRKGLRTQAEGLLTALSHCQALLRAQLQLVDLLPDDVATETTREDVEQQMLSVVTRVSEALNLHPPSHGGIDVKKLSISPTQSPSNFRRSVMEPFNLDLSALRSKLGGSLDATSPVGSPSLSKKSHRMSYPNGRPLPKEPLELPFDPDPTCCILGEYAEISVPELEEAEEEDSGPVYAEARNHTQSGSADSSPLIQRRVLNKQKHLSIASLDQFREAIFLDSTGTSNHESEESAQFSSTEELGLDDPDPVYARVENPSGDGESQDVDDPGYANPIDALQEYLELQQDGTKKVDHPYQTVEEIRRLREFQLHQQRERNASTGSDRDLRTAIVDDNPGYSRPFDALMGTFEPVRVSQRRLNVSPIQWQRAPSPIGAPRSPLLGRSKMNTSKDGEDSGSALGGIGDKKRALKAPRQPSEEESNPDFLSPWSGNMKLLRVSDLNSGRVRSHSDAPLWDEANIDLRPPISVPVSDLGVCEESQELQNGDHHSSEGSPRKSVRHVLDLRTEDRLSVHVMDRRTASDASALKGLKPVTVTKLRSGQARIIANTELPKKLSK